MPGINSSDGRPNGNTATHKVSHRGSTDRELWSSDIELLLLQSAHALGERGTLAGVIATIERGGSAGTMDFDGHMLRLVGYGADVNPSVRRVRRLHSYWIQLERVHQGAHLARYLGETRVDHTIAARFGELAGVVAWHWCGHLSEKRLSGTDATRAKLRTEAETARRDLDGLVRSAGREALARESRLYAVAVGNPQDDLQALVNACRQGEPPGLREKAERAVRAAHRAWNRVAAADAEERQKTKREARAERVAAWLEAQDIV